MTVASRTLGRAGLEVSAVGMGCWAIGGPCWSNGKPVGWGNVDDDESVLAIHRALELGANFFDTADSYGAGHSERVLGRVLADRRDEIVLATKFGNTFDESSRRLTGADASPEYIRRACHASLRRLNTDHIDLYQFHLSGYDLLAAEGVKDVLEELVAEGLIRAYGWSTDDPNRAAVFARGSHCAAVQHELSLLHDAPQMLSLCEREELASINRSPLAMGLLTGKFSAASRLPHDDVRGLAPDWLPYFRDGGPAEEWLERLAVVREILTSRGRTPAIGALAWILGRSDRTIPIPGFRTVAQVEENLATLRQGALTADELREVDELLRRPNESHPVPSPRPSTQEDDRPSSLNER